MNQDLDNFEIIKDEDLNELLNIYGNANIVQLNNDMLLVIYLNNKNIKHKNIF